MHVDCAGDGYSTVTGDGDTTFNSSDECSDYVLGGGTLEEGETPVDPGVTSVTLTWVLHAQSLGETVCEARIDLRDFPLGTYDIYLNRMHAKSGATSTPYVIDTITVVDGTTTYYSIGEDGAGWLSAEEDNVNSLRSVTVGEFSSEWTTVDCTPQVNDSDSASNTGDGSFQD